MIIKLFFLFIILSPSFLTANDKVYNGFPIDPGKVPVAHLINQNGISCSGSVISSKAILTAGHCIDAWAQDKVPLFIYVKGRVYYGIELHRGPNDLGAVKANRKLPSGTYAIKKNLKPAAGSVITLLGFGYPNSGYLYATNQAVNEQVGNDQFLVGYGATSSACEGDSGGPAIGIYKRKTYLFGVISKGINQTCGPVILEHTSSPTNYRWISRIKSKIK